MRSLKSVHVALALTALGVGWVVGCSADGTPAIEDTDAGDDGASSGYGDAGPQQDSAPKPNDATLGNDSTVQGDGSGPDVSVIDSSSNDAQSNADALDAQVIEAGQDAGAQGSPCAQLNQIQQQTCGLCGFQTRTCLATDGGSVVGMWGAWGFCQNEVPGGCTPGTTGQEACGLCGTRQTVCQNDCTWAVGACTGQPANACAPGSIDFEVGLSCDAGGRERSCSDGGSTMPGVAACSWGNFGGCFVPEGGILGASMKIATTVGGKVSNTFTLPANTTIERLDAFGTCPGASVSSDPTFSTSYQYVEIDNPTSQTATVSVWTAKTSGGTDIDTIMAEYNGLNVPLSNAQRSACTDGVDDSCTDAANDPTACQASWAGLMYDPTGTADQSVKIAPMSGVIVYNAAYYGSASSNAHAGDYMMYVRTEKLQ